MNVKYHLHSYNKHSNLHFTIETDVHCRKFHLHYCNRTETPTCINTIKIVTHLFDEETVTCISAAWISHWKIATRKINMHDCNRKTHQHNCNRKHLNLKLKTPIIATDIVTCINIPRWNLSRFVRHGISQILNFNFAPEIPQKTQKKIPSL